MSRRLSEGGRLIDREVPLGFLWNNRRLTGFRGDTLASALLANDQQLAGRSFKYHRPRGIVTAGPEEPNALVQLGHGASSEPNLRATTVELADGLRATSQNHWPSLEFDIGAATGYLAPLFAAGFYYKTFMWPRVAWKHVFEPLIRRSAGLGIPPTQPDPDHYEHYHAHVDVLVVGSGIAGLVAAGAAADAGARVLVLEQNPEFGGRAPVDGITVDGLAASEWIDDCVADLAWRDLVRVRNRTTVLGVYDHGYVLACEHRPRPNMDKTRADAPRQRLWRIRARQIVMATGAIERPLAFAGNDVPGVMLASAARDYAVNFGVGIGDRVVVVTNNDSAYLTATALAEAGIGIAGILDIRESPAGPALDRARAVGLDVRTGMSVASVFGRRQVLGVSATASNGDGARTERIVANAVVMSGGWSPSVHLWSHCGGKLAWDANRGCFLPDADRPPAGADGIGMVIPVGAANGTMDASGIPDEAVRAGREAARRAGHRGRRGRQPSASHPAQAEDAAESQPELAWMVPRQAKRSLRSRAFLDYQNDVKVTDIELAVREGFQSVEHAKRYTTLGMATDQGKLSNVNGIGILATSMGQEIAGVGTTTFRPPYTPLTLGAIAGEAHGPLFKPVRKTPMDGWHDDHGAHWEPVADWRRPYCYLRDGETVKAAINREILNTRRRVGLLDASTLGKILVSGPDSGRFLDMLYTGRMSTLRQGRCRYGLMCNENGFLIDDGVIARLGEETFLCHTTSGGSDRIHAWMEEWLQTEWWTWKVWTVNLTEQFVQVGIVGPEARTVMERLGNIDVSDEALRFMDHVDGELAGFPVRIFRISFSGELSYEIQLPAAAGLEFWTQALEAGADLGIQPYGTEALHVMRAEKGFIMIGDETDGTVTPQDLGLDWAVSRLKSDYLGKRAQARSYLNAPDRWRLVGLATEDPNAVLPDGAYATDGSRQQDGGKTMIGRVTSSYWSPTINRSIALGLVERGPDRMGEVIGFPVESGRTIRAKIVDPVFLGQDAGANA